MRVFLWAGIAAVSLASLASTATKEPAELKITGDWDVSVSVAGAPPTVLHVPPVKLLTITGEKYEALPVFNPNTAGWVKGAPLKALRAQEVTTPSLLDPSSLVVRSGPGADAPVLTQGKDYEADLQWATIGRLAGGGLAEGQPVWADYSYAPLRLDGVMQTRSGKIELRPGEPKSSVPLAPAPRAGERLLATVWLPGRVSRLGADNVFGVSEDAFPEPSRPKVTVAEKLLPKTLRKLRAGEPLRILAWGDSVTDGTFVPHPATERWQEQFVIRLRERYPKAKIELVTEAWGGRNTASYLGEPPGSEHNYQEKVLAVKPDLVVSEFVNDAGLGPSQVEERYSKLLADFQGMGTEWAILTPHYVRPDWMGLTREREIDQDPRPYVAGLRQFGPKHNVAIADASVRYGRLWRQGIPHTTLLLNSVNHPDPRGMKIFADALMELFP